MNGPGSNHTLSRIFSCSLLFAFLGIVFVLSYYNVWQGDDLNYKMIITPESADALFQGDKTPVRSIGDIISSQYQHYFYVNGRSFAHTLVQIFCGLLPQIWFAIFNGIVWLTLIAGIQKLTRLHVLNPKSLLTLLILSVLGLSTRFTPSCQIGYPWMFAFNVWFLYIFLSKQTFNRWQFSLLLFYSFLSGWSQESLVIGLGGAIIIDWLGNWRKWSFHKYGFAIAYGLGGLLLCLSPGSRSRAGEDSPEFILTILNLVCYLKVFYILIAVCLYKAIRRKISLKDIYLSNCFYLNAILILLIFNIVLGVYGNRQLLGIELLSIIVLLRILTNHSFSWNWIIILGLITSYQVFLQIKTTLATYDSYRNLISQYENSSDGTVYLDLTDQYPQHLIIDPATAYLGLLLKIDYPILMERNEIRRIYGKGKDISVKPLLLKNIQGRIVDSRIHKIGSGEFLLIQAEKDPIEFKVYRSISIYGIKIPFSPAIITIDSTTYRDQHWKAKVFGESDMSHLSIDSISIIPISIEQ